VLLASLGREIAETDMRLAVEHDTGRTRAFIRICQRAGIVLREKTRIPFGDVHVHEQAPETFLVPVFQKESEVNRRDEKRRLTSREALACTLTFGPRTGTHGRTSPALLEPLVQR